MIIWLDFTMVLLSVRFGELIEVGNDLKFDVYSNNFHTTMAKTADKTKLTIAIMLPQDYIRLQMDRINKGNWSFNKYFYLDSYTIIIHKNFNDIAQTICALLNTQSNTAIYINYNDFSPIEAINSRLFLKFATFINMPVMTYIPNAYATVKKMRINFKNKKSKLNLFGQN
ncbi:hypothetical protein BpHYR1_016648 [Brachionus plicatilis]|uniref:Uncharacterized protein n=1 Tax=Brachionus plicatilis TaxID=10195 RepID=A0A3M7RBN3_BRAPC|nr:hypothetical protein BpHYR1_016648 [Brachionus plicatilis]